MVGQGGRLYVRSELDQGQLQVAWGAGTGQQCTLHYQVPADADAATTGFISLEAACR